MFASHYWKGADSFTEFWIPNNIASQTKTVKWSYVVWDMGMDGAKKVLKSPLSDWIKGGVINFPAPVNTDPSLVTFVIKNFTPYVEGSLQYEGFSDSNKMTFRKYIEIEPFYDDDLNGETSSTYDDLTGEWVKDNDDPFANGNNDDNANSGLSIARAGIVTGNITVDWYEDSIHSPSPCGIIAYDNNGYVQREVTATMTVKGKTVGYSRGHRFYNLDRDGVRLKVTGLYFDKFVWLNGSPTDVREVKFEVTLKPFNDSQVSISEDVVLSSSSSEMVSPEESSSGEYVVYMESDYT